MSWSDSFPPMPADGAPPVLLAAIARWQGLPVDAVAHLYARLRDGGGGMAQFSHSALGGLGQWLRGGSAMLPLGTTDDLRRRVTGALEMLADLPAFAADKPTRALSTRGLDAARAPALPVTRSPLDGHPCCPHCGGELRLPGPPATGTRPAYTERMDGAAAVDRPEATAHRPTAGFVGLPIRPPAGAAPGPPSDTPVRGFWQSVVDAMPAGAVRLIGTAQTTFHRVPAPTPPAPQASVPEAPPTAASPGHHLGAPVHGGVPPGDRPRLSPQELPPRIRTPPMEPMAPMKPMEPMKPMAPMRSTTPWWPDGLGQPSTTGGQNGMDYAVFPDKHRLAVKSGGQVRLYDTGGKTIHGAGQRQATGEPQGLTFATDGGDVPLSDLKEVKDAG